MASQAQLQQRVLNNFHSLDKASRPPILRLNGGINNSTETVVVDDSTAVSVGDIIEFVSGELGYVITKVTVTLTVIRGWNGTTAATQADNSFIRVNPTPTLQQIIDALTETLHDLGTQGLYTVSSGTDLTLVAGQESYQIVDTDVYTKRGVLSVYYQRPDSLDLVGLPFLNINEPGAEFFTTGSYAVRLLDWGENSAGDTLKVIYAKTLNALADSDASPVLEQALVLGASERVFRSLEGPRIHDPGRFTDRTVQPGQPLRDANVFAAQYQRAVWRYRGHIQSLEADLPGARWRRARRYKP